MSAAHPDPNADILASCGFPLPPDMRLETLIEKMISVMPGSSYETISPLYRVAWLAQCLKAWGAPSVKLFSRECLTSVSQRVSSLYALKVGEGALLCVNGGFGWDDILARAEKAQMIRGGRVQRAYERHFMQIFKRKKREYLVYTWQDGGDECEENELVLGAFAVHGNDAASAIIADIRADLLMQETPEVLPPTRSSSPRL